MSADKKPEKPAEVPPFLQNKAGQPRDGTPIPAPKSEAPPEIPFFLRAGASSLPPELPRPRPPDPPAHKPDPGLLHSLVHKLRPAAPEPAPSPPPAPVSPRPPEDRPAPAFLKPAAQPPESEVELPGLLSPEEVQRKLEELARVTEKKEQQPPPVVAAPPPPPSSRPQSKPIDWESAPAIFEQMVEGIRRDRVSHEREMIDQQSKIEGDWQHVLESMRALQKKVEGHPNLIYFTISRDQQDISVKVVDYTTKRGYSLFTLSRRHPAGAHPSLNAVWLIEFPAREWHYYDAKEAMAELVTRIAGALA